MGKRTGKDGGEDRKRWEEGRKGWGRGRRGMEKRARRGVARVNVSNYT